ncbi:MAG: hypothetical protein KJ645_07040 [Planctomycetes bacterium]|nr:hypothetical protein [Planctomycetota bacterium]
MTDPTNAGLNCSCNASQNPGDDGSFCCNPKPDPFTEEELQIFDHLRMLKKEVRDLQLRLEVIAAKQNGQPLTANKLEEKQYITDRIDALRREWDRLRKESEEASIRRLIELGHIEPQ